MMAVVFPIMFIAELPTAPENYELGESAGDIFHAYGVWWEDIRSISFYSNGICTHTVETVGDFDMPMQINMNNETQTWIGAPIPEKLEDESLNKTYIYYIRTWKLVRD